jgi:glycosyltransferase involved in cell wall biosynthesis
LVSVVMPVFHPDSNYFPCAVQSILHQTFQDFELIIVEDPSPRRGRDLIAHLRDPRIYHLANTQRTSLVEQRNLGLAAARGEFLALLDADDIAETDRLDKQLAFLRDHPEVDVLGSQITLIDASGQVCGYRSFPTSHEAILKAMHRIVPFSQPSVMIRREVLKRWGGYRLRKFAAAEDYELWCRLARAGVRFANHPEALIRYRLHPSQLKVTHLRETIRAVLEVRRMYWLRQLDWTSRLRMLGERLLLMLPSWFVIRLLIWMQYRVGATHGPRTIPTARPGSDRVAPELLTSVAASVLGELEPEFGGVP